MIGLVTIGQSPRDDIVSAMFLPLRTPRLVEAGALDTLSLDDIHALRPSANEHLLVTRLRDDSEVTVAKERLIPLVQRAVDQVVEQGARVVCVLCTGAFANLNAPVPLVFPDRVMSGAIDGIRPAGTLGILMPHLAQHDSMVAKWTRPTRAVETGAASPYSETDELRKVARELEERGADLIVMDCMGFSRSMQSQVASATRVPVVLANALVGAVLSEVFLGRVG